MVSKNILTKIFAIITFIYVINKAEGAPLNETDFVPSWEQLGFTLQDDVWRPPAFQLGQAGGNVVKWDNGRIPYEFDRSYPSNSRQNVEAGIAQFNRRIGTCVKIVPKTSSDQYFVRIMNGAGCNSYVGKYTRGGQQMNLNSPGCTSPGVVIHEFMHATGFEHEHQRSDRDNYITVHYENIKQEWQRWWQPERNMKILGPFNCKSIMHYPAINGAYSINNKPAFTGKAGVDCREAGNRKDFEESDLAVIKKLYNCR